MAESPIDRPTALQVRCSDENRPEIALQQTCVMPVQAPSALDESEFDELLALSNRCGFSKQEIDFALAASLLRERRLSERHLRDALKGWTSFGSLSLCQFLQRNNVLPQEELSAIQYAVLNQLNLLQSNSSWENCRHVISKRTSWLLGQLDPDGRVAKILGVSQIPKTADGREKRSFLAQYHLLRKLGQGGLGTVWLAIEAGLNRYVALKEIATGNSQNAATLSRFQREAEITGRLDHPGIVPIHLLGRDESDGRAF